MEHRRSYRRLIVAAAVTVSVTAAAVAWTWPWLQGRHHRPDVARVEAETIMNLAVVGEGMVASELNAARDLLNRAYREDRRQQAGFPWRRDYRVAESDYRKASASAAEALSHAARLTADARRSAETVVSEAEAVVASVSRMAVRVPFPPADRQRLQRAKTLATEARMSFRKGKFDDAKRAAKRAGAEAQNARTGALPGVARYSDPELVGLWRRWVKETIARSRSERRSAIVVLKERNEVELYVNGHRTKVYAADLGKNRLKPKLVAGDGATPEGCYHITAKKQRGQTIYYKALMLDYPNDRDRRQFAENRRAGRISSGARLGYNIEIHGHGGRDSDWTLGCVALSDRDMDDLFTHVGVGTPVTIVGGDGRGGAFTDAYLANGGSMQGAR